MFLCLNRLMSKYGKRIVLIFLYALYKARRNSESSFSHSSVFHLLVMQRISSFFKQVYFEKILLARCWFPSTRCPFRSLYMQIYPLNTCKLDLEENLFDFYVESVTFRIKIFMSVTSI